MKIIPGNGHDPGDDLQRLLQEQYAIPHAESYWSALEQRIMERVRGDAAREWYSYFPGWVRYGVAAAAAAILFASVASWQARSAEERMAYRELFDATDVPVLSERAAPQHQEREHTLRYLLTH